MLPPKNHPRWKELVRGKLKKELALHFLATQFFLTRVIGVAARDPSPGRIAALIDEAYAFFEKNERLVKKDIVAIFGEEYE
jgi:hypothetical protein